MPARSDLFRNRLRGILAAVGLFAGGTAFGLEIDYDPARPAELRPCDAHQHRGRIAEARACYEALITEGSTPLVRAEAAWGVGDVRRANELFREAIREQERAVQPRVRWGRLYLATHQHADAAELFSEALEIDRGNLRAKLGMAQVLADQFEGGARPLVEELLKEDDTLIDAYLLAARMDLEEGRYAEAERRLQRALNLTERQKQPPLEVYELLAALELMRGHANGGRWPDRALKYNP